MSENKVNFHIDSLMMGNNNNYSNFKSSSSSIILLGLAGFDGGVVANVAQKQNGKW